LSITALSLWVISLFRVIFNIDLNQVEGYLLVIISISSCAYFGVKAGSTANENAIPLFSGIIFYYIVFSVE